MYSYITHFLKDGKDPIISEVREKLNGEYWEALELTTPSVPEIVFINLKWLISMEIYLVYNHQEKVKTRCVLAVWKRTDKKGGSKNIILDYSGDVVGTLLEKCTRERFAHFGRGFVVKKPLH